MPGLPHCNTTLTRDAATDVLADAFPNAKRQTFRDLMDNNPTIITVEKGYDADSVSLGQIPSVCIFMFWFEEGVQPWLEIKWLATNPALQHQGYGTAALRGALLYAKSHGVQDQFGLHADATATEFYRKCMMATSDALGKASIQYDDDGEPVSQWMEGSIEKALQYLPTADIEVSTIDPGAYDAIRCKTTVSGRTFQVHFTYDGWKDITEVDPW
jgi:GNAT superfamily N-acetyltransferase